MSDFDHLEKFKTDDAPITLPEAGEKPVFAPAAAPRSEVREEGVLWRGPWDSLADGTSVATRLHILALEKAGVPVKLFAPGAFLEPLPGRPGGFGTLDPMVIAQVGHLRKTELKRITATVHHLLPTYDGLKQALYPLNTDAGDRELIERTHARKILLTVLERDRVDPRIMEMINRFGQVWVPCARNANVLIACGAYPDRVHVVPHPYDEASPMLAIRQTPMAPEPMNFLAMGKWEPRKNLDAVIGGFMLSISSPCYASLKESWRLIVKTSGFARVPGYPESATASVRKWLEDDRVKKLGWTSENVADRILIIQNMLPQSDVIRLYRGAHRFITASHGEAFDLPAFDACLAGIPLIHSGFGGSEDYAPYAQKCWKGDMEDVHPMYKWTRAKWARVTAEAVAVELDRLGMESGDLLRRQDFDLSAYSPTRVGQQMADLIARLS